MPENFVLFIEINVKIITPKISCISELNINEEEPDITAFKW